MDRKVGIKAMAEAALGSFWFDVVPLITIPFIIQLVQVGDVRRLVVFSLLVIIFYVFIWIIHVSIRKWDLSARHIYEYKLEDRYRKTFILKDNASLEKIGTGKVQSIIQKGMNAWVYGVWEITYQVPRVLFTVITSLYINLKLGFWFALVFVFVATFGGISYVYFRNKRMITESEIEDIDNIKNDNSVRVIMSRQEIVYSGKVQKEVELMKKLKLDQYDVDQKSAKYDQLADLSISSLGILLPFIGSSVMLYNFSDHTNSADIISYIYFTTRFTFLMWGLMWAIRQFFDQYPKISKLWDFIDSVPQLKNYEEGEVFVHKKGEIELKNISFSYENIQDELVNTEEKMVLKDFSLKIEAGSKVALVGRSGSGKTTIAKLISGYMRPTEGQVLVDGQDLAEVSLKSYYKYIGYLTQEPMVFDGSVRENLLYAVSEEDLPKITEDKIREVLELAQCDFILNMKDGLETQIGEKGIRLSGGERQRLAIAKLFLKNPEIIILDEPTSALDSFSEEAVTKAMENLFKGRTVVIIAHRLQTVKRADEIIVLEEGVIKERGMHNELISNGGHYAKMLEMQSGF
jgi:ABC-type multidrug transport system fused ATPase/permease subunit